MNSTIHAQFANERRRDLLAAAETYRQARLASRQRRVVRR